MSAVTPLDAYDNGNGSVTLAWGAFPGAASYNVYVNGVLNQNVATLRATVTGLTAASYSSSAVTSSTGNSKRPQNMPPNGVVTPAATYALSVTALVGGVERATSRAFILTPQPSSIMLTTPMRRPFPFPATGMDNGGYGG